MQNKKKVWWKWLLYPLTIIIGILLIVIFPYFIFNCPWNWLWFYARWFIIAFILFTFRKERKKWLKKSILKIILIIKNNIIEKRKIFFIDKEKKLTKANF